MFLRMRKASTRDCRGVGGAGTAYDESIDYNLIFVLCRIFNVTYQFH